MSNIRQRAGARCGHARHQPEDRPDRKHGLFKAEELTGFLKNVMQIATKLKAKLGDIVLPGDRDFRLN
jgi:hypothetical protein